MPLIQIFKVFWVPAGPYRVPSNILNTCAH